MCLLTREKIFLVCFFVFRRFAKYCLVSLFGSWNRNVLVQELVTSERLATSGAMAILCSSLWQVCFGLMLGDAGQSEQTYSVPVILVIFLVLPQ